MSPRRFRGSGGDDGGQAWSVDVREYRASVDPAKRIAWFVSYCADFVGGMAVKLGLLLGVCVAIGATLQKDWSSRMAWGCGVLMCGLFVWSGLWQMVAVKRFTAIDEGRGESMLRTMKLAMFAGFPSLLGGGAMAAWMLTTATADDLDVKYMLGGAIVFVVIIGGPLAAAYGVGRYGKVYRALDQARAKRWPKRFAGSGDVYDEDDPEFDPDDPAMADPREVTAEADEE